MRIGNMPTVIFVCIVLGLIMGLWTTSVIDKDFSRVQELKELCTDVNMAPTSFDYKTVTCAGKYEITIPNKKPVDVALTKKIIEFNKKEYCK
jgi:hypothetical protein